ncbi:hypothetical protein [Granulicella sp. L60]|uniref:hypothetical protein n=1 Tax=Granulicella sp. L60 TaxID=1641866 RepID=UPI00131DCCFD|nr:hypothetical protein [Granulicella sp. L60]
MQRIHRTRPNGVRSHKPVQRGSGPHASGANGVTDATGVALLAPAFAQALPSLAGLPTEYSHEFRAELVYDLCAALVREGLGTCESWKECGESVLVFAKHAIMRAIGEDRWNLLQRNVEYHLEISDVADREGFDEVMGDGQLAITVVCGGSGYLKIGPAIEALEAESPGLGAAFYWTLTYALYRLMRVYNHDDALQYEERMQEYAEQDHEENKGQYEFPEVEKALPECIRLSLQKDNHDRWNLGARRLLLKHGNGRYGSWIKRLRKLQQLSQIRVWPTYSFIEQGNYDSPPLPSLLVAFKERDAITACFDEEGQYMLEETSEPAVGVAFHPQNPEEARQALRIVERFVLFNHELFQLVEELQEWEKSENSHADTHLNR